MHKYIKCTAFGLEKSIKVNQYIFGKNPVVSYKDEGYLLKKKDTGLLYFAGNQKDFVQDEDKLVMPLT